MVLKADRIWSFRNKIYVGRLLIGLIGIVGAFVTLISIVDEVQEGSTLAIDQHVLMAINRLSSKFLDSFFVLITELGSIWFILSATTLLGLYLHQKKRWRSLLFLVVTIGGTGLINIILKTIFARQRPSLWEQLIYETGYSFPSGHAMASCALGLALIVITWRSRYRWVVVVGSTSYILTIGFSRLYLGVHYPTDILAGWLTTICWATLAASLYGIRYFKKKR